MCKTVRPLAFVLASTVLLSAAPSGAQQYSDEELLRLFQIQRDAFRAAGESTTGGVRGLTLMTVDDLVPGDTPTSPAAPEPADTSATAPQAGGGISAIPSPATLEAPATDPGATVSATATPSALVTAPQPLASPASESEPQKVIFGALDPALQVNVTIRFGFDSAALAEDQKPALAQLCKVMKGSDIKLFRIVGHTDAAGSDPYNERLSKLRAQEVQRYFVHDCGIDAGRIEAIGMGERFLANPGDPKAAENRRVEFQALS